MYLPLLAAAACAGDVGRVARTEAPLFGAESVPQGEWPSVVPVGETCSGVLVHPRVVVYAAHCGAAFESIMVGDAEIAVARCEPHPDAPPANNGAGLIVTPQEVHPDVAFCVLERAAAVEAVAPLVGCEQQALQADAPVIMVGYGGDSDTSEFGTKRVAEAHVVSVSDEFAVEAEGVGSCSGDSGGPALLELADGSMRVAGILSSSPNPGCEENLSFYSNLAEYVAWIEDAAELDVTPCFDYADGWRRNGDCDDATTCHEPDSAGHGDAGGCGIIRRPASDGGKGIAFAILGAIPVLRRHARRSSSAARRRSA